jgi:hypothetical protein
MMKANAHAAFKVKLSGQLRFLGSFIKRLVITHILKKQRVVKTFKS